jgi:hypothetical protein
MTRTYTLLNGMSIPGDDLASYYSHNVQSGRLPVAGYFCPCCYHELGEDFVCYWCDNEDRPKGTHRLAPFD